MRQTEGAAQTDGARRTLRIGIVCPYSFDVPGGVQFHIRDLAAELNARGHRCAVIAPASAGTALPASVTSAGGAVSWRYNGAVARLSFGPRARRRVAAWLDDGDFDVIHLHEPGIPSLSLHALYAATVPVVATFHAALTRSRLLHTAYPLLRPAYEKIAAGIAVSEQARRTVVEHMGTDPLIVPNGVRTGDFARAPRRAEWTGTPAAPTIAFLGRLDEPRKGLAVLGAAAPALAACLPGIRFLVAGNGDAGRARARFGDAAGRVEFLGPVSEEDKQSLFASADAYVAPHLGGESFGIVLVEAMAAGTPVLASDLDAFTAVLDAGDAGVLFPTGDAGALAASLLDLLTDRERRAALTDRGHRRAALYDWDTVTDRVLDVYDMVLHDTRESGRQR